jgi:hypothetical protein
MAATDPDTAALTVATRHGSTMQNPLYSTMRQAANDMVRYAAEFGFTPRPRGRRSASSERSRDPASLTVFSLARRLVDCRRSACARSDSTANSIHAARISSRHGCHPHRLVRASGAARRAR